MEAIYTAVATATGGRDGHVSTSDGVLDFDLRIPGAMGGQGGNFTNPEQLFAAGYAACYNGAFNLAARLERIETGTVSVTASVSIGKDGNDGFMLAVRLDIFVPGTTKENAKKLADRAHCICPYSKAVLGNIAVTTEVSTDR